MHQGNGTATIFKGERLVFTFSMHQFHNYPAEKPRGSLDIGLVDGAGDIEYLHTLREALPKVMASEPEMVFYLAGADPYDDDQLGGLCLTRRACASATAWSSGPRRRRGCRWLSTLAGGYARRLSDTVAIHIATVEEASAAGQD